ncbi:glycosyltransferase [Methylobacter sp.]|uniref:glycosyltransferase n=1 Tax=Methylobacter sp. TaxID=2051955 RepID=UPI002FDDD2CF
MPLIRFLIVGAANTLVGLSTIYFAMYFLQLDIVHANAIGYSLGILLGFALNKTWTFSCRGAVISSFIRYLLVLAVAYAANLATVLSANSHFNLNPYIAQALGIIPYTVIGFMGSRYFAFCTQRGIDMATDHLCETAKFNEKPMIPRMIDVSIILPCYNEEAVLLETTRQLADLLKQLIIDGKVTPNSRVYYIDDGSRDRTWEMIESLAETHEFIHGIKLSRNRGHQNALLAGLLTAEGEAIISVDADLQDDLSAIKKMIELYAAGYDIVYGVRDARMTDTFFKRFTAKVYYRLLSSMGVEIIYNHADYRLMSRQAIEALREFGEVNLFLRGIIPQIGFSYALVYYDRAERYAGESKYPLKKMLSFAWQGITSFSDLPLRIITSLGLLVSLISFLVTVWAIAIRLFTQDAIPGWASTVLPIYFLGGIQLLCLGIMGEYLAKIYSETKRRPRYTIEKMI